MAEDRSNSKSGDSPAKRKRDVDSTSILNLDNLDANALKKLQGEQLDRFEAYRRSAIPRAAMKKLLLSVTGQVPDTTLIIVACGVAKLLVGELVETAKKVAKEKGHEEGKPLRVEDFKRAYASTLEDTQLPIKKCRKRLM